MREFDFVGVRMIQPIEWRGDHIRFLDQTLLPAEERYVETSDIRMLAQAIKTMQLRGAPLIGIAAAYGLLLGLRPVKDEPIDVTLETLHASVDLLSATRPTAKNLTWALERMQNVVRLNHTNRSPVLIDMLEQEAKAIHDEDRRMCDSMGFYGEQLIEHGMTILTHCNTGSLATGGIGTALGAIKTAHNNGKKIGVYVDETRPLYQGARLTMWELMKERIPATVITDSSAAWTMATKSIGAVIVGADRIATNGDTANKIGTYTLAILAKEFGVPFYVVAPTSTIDLSMPDGKKIPIEERDPVEITGTGGHSHAPEHSSVFAPAFDVTPSALITAIVTEKGIHRPPFDSALKEAAAR